MKKAVFALAVLLLLSTPVMAKEGLYAGAYLIPSSDISGRPGIESGSGYGFRAGLGLNRYFAIEGSFDIAEQDVNGGPTIDLKGLAVDLKVNFPLTSLDSNNVMSLEPFIRLGFGTYELSRSGWSSSGNGARFGVGIELYLFRELSVSGGWTRTNVSFDNPSEDGSVRIVDVGLTYHFL